jgi:hypothetical protein
MAVPFLTMAELRERVAVAVDAIAGWKRSRVPPGRFKDDTDQLLPKCFGVEISDTVLHSTPGRQTPTIGAYVESLVEVAWAYRLRGDNPINDLDNATAAEATITAAVVGISQDCLHLTFASANRDTSTEQWVLGSLRFRTIHQLALS